MIPFLSLVTSVKDYVEIVHKLVETHSTESLTTYYDLGATLTFSILLLKEKLLSFLSLKWIQDTWSISPLIPDIASSLISEVSIFDGLLKDNFELLEKPLSYGNQNLFIYCLEKCLIGFFNSIFLCLATGTSSIIILRRFVMQGLEAGYIAGLGSILGNIIWIGSIIFGFRFLVIPWLSLDILRYILGFVLLIKYMWDSYSERRTVLTDFSKKKIFLFNFFLAFTEQTNMFPFLNNISLGSDSRFFETFPLLSNHSWEFFLVHGFYLLGLLLGSLSLLQFFSWFFENPAYSFYLWTMSSFKLNFDSSKILNFVFLYLTMICTFNSVGYYGLDYLTNNLGFVHEDRLVEQKTLLETSFLNTKASDRNTRRNRGRHGRRERWKRRVRSYRTFDTSLYNNGVYDLFTLEDLNYGFDRFWLRRKMRNHRVRFRFFPGPWMRSLKKQFARPRLESFIGPRVEFFRILFEQAYHPEFHEFATSKKQKKTLYNLSQTPIIQKDEAIHSFLRKFLRKTDNRFKSQQIKNLPLQTEKIYDFHFQSLFHEPNFDFSKILYKKDFFSTQKKLSRSDQLMTEYKNNISKNVSFLHPLKFYLQKDKAFRKKCQFYGVKHYRTYSVENNAPYFRVMMKRFFYHYKPTLRWERTMRVATMRKARRKGSRVSRKWTNNKMNNDNISLALDSNLKNKENNRLQKPTHFYSLVSKKASRYRYQIYKDVLQHWYYSKMNRLLLKFDVDSFIKRQPKFHHLTKNEETVLHMKRFLLFDYYNSLRWYNLMQHYDTMKKVVNKTKSFSNRAYNQQFFGTFKKIRHLFSITPSFNQKVLKFDQPLYNEFSNSKTLNSMIHEELNENDFLYSPLNNGRTKTFSPDSSSKDDFQTVPKENLKAFPLLKKYQNNLYNQRALKNFLLITKNEKQSNKMKKILKTRLEKWSEYSSSNSNIELQMKEKDLSTFPSTIQKALKESIQPHILGNSVLFKSTHSELNPREKKKSLANLFQSIFPFFPSEKKEKIKKNEKNSYNSDFFEFKQKNWKEKVLSKRKKIRKTFKRLKNIQNFQFNKDSIFLDFEKNELNSSSVYKKLDTSDDWRSYLSSQKDISWKKRRSRIRRSRFFKGRGPIRKVNSKMKRSTQKSRKNLFEKKWNEEKKLFEVSAFKQSRTLVKKHRYWKKHKKPVFAQNKRKLRKKRRYLKSKMRVLTKKLKKEEFQLFLRKWWWQNFFPQFKKGNSYKINKNKIALKFEDILLSRKTKAVLNQPKIVLPNSTEYSNIIPFYAGWDENSRQFVITNRLLSRKKSMFFGEGQNHFLNSMNAATTLYWQIPFTTYDPDQFFALGMDGFSPIGWKNFTFLQTTQPLLIQNFSTMNSLKQNSSLKGKKFRRLDQILSNRRIQKPYKRVKKHPRPPVWFPSGPLTSQILPVHYIYVFYKRYGLPRDRYIRRKLRTTKNAQFSSNSSQIYDYTFRKRVKPKRKYHRKNQKLKTENRVNKILRRPFRDHFPSKISLKNRPGSILQKNRKEKFKNFLSSKQQGRDNLRLRQLRRRVQRQVWRPVWRYKPQAGGFIWPGDYLRLDSIKAPNLGNTSIHEGRKIRKKKRRIVPEWQIQPKKYLLQKHNKKVFKKRLEKSQNKFY